MKKDTVAFFAKNEKLREELANADDIGAFIKSNVVIMGYVIGSHFHEGKLYLTLQCSDDRFHAVAMCHVLHTSNCDMQSQLRYATWD